MKELYEIHDKILLRGIDVDPERRINFSRDVFEDLDAKLPADLRPEIDALQTAINASLPEDFDYFAFVGSEIPPEFDLLSDQTPVSDPDKSPFDSEQSLIPQLKALDWDALRAEAEESDEELAELDELVRLLDRPQRTTKQIQKDFREDCKDFIKDKRRDDTKIFVLWTNEQGLLINEFADGDKLREALPSLVYKGSEVIAIVAFGRPLPVERIDVLIGEARKKFFADFEQTAHELDSPPENSDSEESSGPDEGKSSPE
jgi:hypothetical protein